MKLILKSLINNNSCIDGGRKRKWWISLIILLISLIIAVVPKFVTEITRKGSALISNNTYMLEYAFKGAFDENSNASLALDENGKLTSTGFPIEYKHTSNPSTQTGEGLNVEKVDAKFFYQIELSDKTINPIIEANNDCSIIIFGENKFYIRVVNVNSSSHTVVGTLYCENAWKDFKSGTDFVTLINDSDIETVRSNLISFLDKAYNYQRVTNAWINTGLFAGIDLLVVLLMGLMIFILTRGKTNPFRMYTFIESMRISFWATLSPAILTVALGFLITNLMDVLFPFLLGIRVMWLTMKSLRPDGTGYVEQKEVKTTNVKSK